MMEQNFDSGHFSDLMKKLNKQRLNGDETCDILLKCDGKDFHAHKNILANLSEYFNRLFFSEMQEKYQDVIEISAVNSETFEQILNFVYTGKITINADNVDDVLNAANYFLLKDLLNFCCTFLLNIMDCTNAIQYWKTGKRLCIETLEKSVQQFITQHFRFLSDVQGVNAMDRTTFKEFLEAKSEDDERAFQLIVSWVKHDLKERKHLFPQFLDLLDFSSLSPSFFCFELASESLVQSFQECLLRMAKHLRHLHGPRPEYSILIMNENSTVLIMLDLHAAIQKEIAILKKPRKQASFAIYKNYLYMVGGFIRDAKSRTGSVRRMDLRCPKKGWEKQPTLNIKRREAGVAVLNDTIFVFGGFVADVDTYTVSNVPEKIEIEQEEEDWTKISKTKKLPIDLTVCQGVLYSMYYQTALTCEKYDPVTETSTVMHQLPKGCVKLVAMEDQLYALCKIGEQLSIWKYDPVSGESQDESEIINIGEFRDACAAHGQIVVSYESSQDSSACISAYNFDAKEWKLVISSPNTSAYWKLIPFHSNPFE